MTATGAVHDPYPSDTRGTTRNGVEVPEGTEGDFAIAPFHGRGTIEASSPPRPSTGTIRRAGTLELLGGIASQAKLAISNALALQRRSSGRSSRRSRHSRTRSRPRTSTLVARALDHRPRRYESVGARAGAARARSGSSSARSSTTSGRSASRPTILTKPGPLTPDERAIVETHPDPRRTDPRADRAARRGPPHRPRRTSATTGRAIPTALSGEQIPLESRIVFACDAFHAMTTDRPYREPLGVDEARAAAREAPARSSTRRSWRRCCACSRRDPRASRATAASALRSPRNAQTAQQAEADRDREGEQRRAARRRRRSRGRSRAGTSRVDASQRRGSSPGAAPAARRRARRRG